MSSRFHPFLYSLCAFGTVLSVCAPAHAFPPSNLADVIARSADRDRRRIPLLVLDAEKTRVTGSSLPLWEMYRDENAPPPLADVLPLFKRQIVSCGSVRVVAPLTRVNLIPPPGKPEEWAQVGRERAARQLFASLSDAQWKAAASAEGLGIGALQNPEQKAWFLALSPEPFTLKEVVSANAQGSYSTPEAPRTVTVDPAQVRVRVTRDVSWNYRQKDSQSAFHGYGTTLYQGHPEGEKFWVAQTPDVGNGATDSYRDRIVGAVRVEEPNRLRKSDIAFNTAPLFGKSVAVRADQSVGELMRAVAEATGLELYADRRFGGMRVTTAVGADAQTSADTADLIKALCYAVGGAVRKVSDTRTGEVVYILTSDRDSMVARRLRLAEWAADVEALESGERETFETAMRDGGFARNIGFADESRAAVSPATMRIAEKNLVDPERWRKNSGYTKIPVTELSPMGKAQVARDLARRESQGESAAFETENVYASFSTSLQLLVPGHGTFGGPGLGSLDRLLPRPAMTPRPRPVVPQGIITIPEALLRFAVLEIAPKGDGEVERAALWARKHGFTGLFVRVPLWDDDASARLADWVAIGHRHGIRVYPTVSLLRADSQSEAAKKRVPVRNLWGETLREYAFRRGASATAKKDRAYAAQVSALAGGIWLDVSDAATRDAIASRVRAVAKTPGIAGMVWEDIAAPGSATRDNSGYTEGGDIGAQGGYDDSARVAFIRKENLDPIDLAPNGNLPPNIMTPEGGWIPFFPTGWDFEGIYTQTPAYRRDKNSGTWRVMEPSGGNGYTGGAATEWDKFRFERSQESIAEIRKAALASDALALYVEHPVEPGGWRGGISLWRPTDAKIPATPLRAPFLPYTMLANSTADNVQFGLGPQLAQRLGTAKPPRYGGLLIDATAKPVDEALALLAPLSPAEK